MASTDELQLTGFQPSKPRADDQPYLYFRPGRGDLTVAGLYFILTLLLTWPLVLHLRDQVVGIDVDEGIFVWNLWWVRHALLELRQSPFSTDFIFYPVGVSLVYYTLTLFNALIAIPVHPILGIFGTINVILILSLAASGFSAFLLYREILGDTIAPPYRTAAAFVGGAVFAFAASRWVYASFGSANLTSVWPIPLFVLAMIRSLRGIGGWAQPAQALVWLTITITLELTLVVFELFLVLPLIIAALVMAVRARALGPLLVRLGGIGVGGIAVLTPLLLLMRAEDQREGAYLVDKWGYADGFSADLMSFVIPTRLHPLLGEAAREWTREFTDVNIVFLGYGVLFLAAIGIWRHWAATKLWFWSAVTYLVLCLGPILHVFGRSSWTFDGVTTNVPLPYIVLHWIPLISANRFPNRFSIPLTLCLGALVAFGAATVLAGRRREGGKARGKEASIVPAPGTLTPTLSLTREREQDAPYQPSAFRLQPMFAAGLLIVVLFDQIAMPLPLNDLRPPRAYEMIAADPGDFVIAQLPLGWRNSYGVLGIERTTIQSYQWLHSKRMIGGNISRNPPFKFTYFADLPVFGSIAAIEQGTPVDSEVEAADRAVAPELIALYDLRYLVVHRRYLPPGIETYAQRVLPLDLLDDDGSVALYRVRQAAPPSGQRIAFGEVSARPYRGDGWTGEERFGDRPIRWAIRSGARIFLRRPGDGESTISVRAAPFDYTNRPAGRFRLRLNGHLIGEWPFESGFQTYRTAVPASLWRGGANHLDVESDPVISPRDALPADRQIGRTGRTAPVDLLVDSANLDAGDRARIVVDDRDVARNRRGYNVVVVDPGSGRVKSSTAYDTFAEDSASDRLADVLDSVPEGDIVAIAVRDEGSARLGERAVQALRRLGIESDLRGRFRWAQAAIGVQGAQPGTALEATSERSASVSLGRSTDRRTLAAAVEWVDVQPR